MEDIVYVLDQEENVVPVRRSAIARVSWRKNNVYWVIEVSVQLDSDEEFDFVLNTEAKVRDMLGLGEKSCWPDFVRFEFMGCNHMVRMDQITDVDIYSNRVHTRQRLLGVDKDCVCRVATERTMWQIRKEREAENDKQAGSSPADDD